jgi:hypothetical protein
MEALKHLHDPGDGLRYEELGEWLAWQLMPQKQT